MGLQSALTTALTGLQAAETTIDVAGNNVANSSTDGFKQSHVLFANQFLQTQSIGSAPSPTNGGTNPRQIGLGVKVAAINPDFSQGTIQISSNPLDVAIQGDGFLIVQGAAGQEYTRNGQLQTNSLNQIVTATGAIVLGQAADANFNIDNNSELVPLRIPVGNQSVTQATKTATLSGVLTPLADVAMAGVIASAPLGDFTVEFPPGNLNSNTQLVGPPITSGSTGVATAGTSANTAGNYEYKVVWFSNSTQAGPSESAPSAAIAVPGVNAGDTIALSGLPVDSSASPLWDGRRIYRSTDGGTTFNKLADLPVTGMTFDDSGALASGATLDTKVLDQKPYSYYVTFAKTGLESRPSALIGPYSVSDTTSRVRLDNIPQPTGSDGFDKINIYRNTGANPSDFELVDRLDLGTTSYIDEKSDAEIVANAHPLDQLGAKAATTTLLTDVVVQDGSSYSRPFVPGTLSFTGTRGGRTLDTKTFTITSTSNVGDLEAFMSQAFGIDTSDVNSASDHAGVALSNGQIVFTSNDGIENALGVDLTSLSLKPAAASSPTTSIALKFNTTPPAAVGAGSTTDFVVFDKLGEPIKLRITTALETKSGTDTTYRWFATSGDNRPADPTNVSTFLGSGLLTFDANGVLQPDQATPKIAILHPAADPLGVTLDFSHVTGLAQTDSLGNNVSVINLTQQDGFPPGTLTSFTITESGLIRGVFSNGAERPLGQIRMARFANNSGLTQNGNNLYTQGINSGAAVIGNPGDNGVGTLTSGAVELSNADIGQNLIDLILASTQYRGGARVITTAQQLFDELLQLRAG